jgi:hypothetical protein
MKIIPKKNLTKARNQEQEGQENKCKNGKYNMRKLKIPHYQN